jgi:hypothetical protein
MIRTLCLAAIVAGAGCFSTARADETTAANQPLIANAVYQSDQPASYQPVDYRYGYRYGYSPYRSYGYRYPSYGYRSYSYPRYYSSYRYGYPSYRSYGYGYPRYGYGYRYGYRPGISFGFRF